MIDARRRRQPTCVLDRDPTDGMHETRYLLYMRTPTYAGHCHCQPRAPSTSINGRPEIVDAAPTIDARRV
jgi:hypothetical protein